MNIPKATFTVGDAVNVRCEEAGCAPTFPAVVSAARYTHEHIEYAVTEEGGLESDGYTAEFLTPANASMRHAGPETRKNKP